ncbi:MAG: hypothetical protein FWC54_00935 [Actinomycetia bacterium]|nr:hypothetical protein [Actinomycetes bacterium]
MKAKTSIIAFTIICFSICLVGIFILFNAYTLAAREVAHRQKVANEWIDSGIRDERINNAKPAYLILGSILTLIGGDGLIRVYGRCYITEDHIRAPH